MVSSPSQDRFPSRSPERDNRSASPRAAVPEALPEVPALLMPPPTTWTSNIRHSLALGLYHLTAPDQSLPHILRLALFLAKMLTLSRPCWPYTVNPWLGGALVLLAVLDLGAKDDGRRRRGWRGQTTGTYLAAPGVGASVLLALGHLGALWVAGQRGVLCAEREDPWHTDGDV